MREKRLRDCTGGIEGSCKGCTDGRVKKRNTTKVGLNKKLKKDADLASYKLAVRTKPAPVRPFKIGGGDYLRERGKEYSGGWPGL